ncbi:unnamed protein product [Phytophthora lilii]|uniref:Unnamed protein product n=1 Tax=Phytophthora lilii TaxID=2077276 RepID=A0A9W6TED9_9STRA|nr:unnamed protein product [Phytophthora lilii]
MQDKTLNPPNCPNMSDDIIGSVAHRRWPLRHSLSANVGYSWYDGPHKEHGSTFQRNSASTANKSVYSITSEVSHTPSMSDLRTIADQSTVKELQEIIKANLARQRRAQRRYVDKKRRETAALEKNVPELREEVACLEDQRDNLVRGVLPNSTIWSASVQYFRVYEYGLSSQEPSYLTALKLLQNDGST